MERASSGGAQAQSFSKRHKLPQLVSCLFGQRQSKSQESLAQPTEVCRRQLYLPTWFEEGLTHPFARDFKGPEEESSACI